MNPLFDAHLHLDPGKASPIDDLLEELRSNGIAGANLILNSPEEKECFRRDRAKLEKSGVRFVYSLTYDRESFDFMRRAGIPFWMKVHPRLENLTAGDIPRLAEIVAKEDPAGIIVDCWPDDLSPENDCGAKIGTALAAGFPQKPVVLAHAGGIFFRETLFLSRKPRNIFYDTALTANYFFGSAMRQDFVYALRFFGGRIMFGSDRPDFPVKEALRVMEEILRCAEADDELRRRYSGANARRIYLGETEAAR